MNIPFKQEINGKKTYFAEKIWKNIPNSIDIPYVDFVNLNMEHLKKYCPMLFDMDYILNPKIHTIREQGKFKHLKVGSKIHCIYNNRTKDRFQFAPTFECKGIQKIEIFNLCDVQFVNIDNKQLTNNEIEKLSINDGFITVFDFWNFFKTKVDISKPISSFKGRVIHFTDFCY